jgi:HK97 family phage portal protein
LFLPAETRAVASGSPAYNPFENPSLPLAAVGLDNVFGRSNNDAGMSVTADSAAGVGTFYRCLFLLSSVVASCPVEVYRKKDQEQIDNPLFDEENDALTYTPFEYMQLVMVYRLVWGNSYVFKKRDAYDRIIDLKPIYPELVEVKPGPDGHKIFLVKRLKPDGTIDQNEKPYVYTDFEIMHIPGLSYDGLQGMSIVTLMAQTLGTAMAADKLAAKFYSSGSQLGGIIKVKAPLRSQAQAEGIKARWMTKNAGVAHAGDVAVLDAETDFQSVTIPPDQLQFLESRRWQTTEIARWFGVPPHLVGDVEKSTSWGTGIEVQNVGLTTYTLRGHTDPIEQRHTREVVQTRGHRARFNLDDLMRGSTAERYTALASAVGGPWMTRNEARKGEKRMPLGDPEYDELLPPQGIGPVEDDQGSQQTSKPQPQGNGKPNAK